MLRLRQVLIAGAAVASLGALVAATGASQSEPEKDPASGPAAAAAPSDPAQRRAFFGELHLHTGYSFDAYTFMSARTTPDEAYRFGQGEPITYLGQTVQRSRPLDFMAVTDHAEYLGVIDQMKNPQSNLSLSELGKQIREGTASAFWAIFRRIRTHQPPPDEVATADAWQTEVDAANRHNQPGKFTTFVAFEWSTMEDDKYNLHRNVIFRGAPPQRPYSAVDSSKPEDLWTYLEKLRAEGIEALAIPHNANASGGLMFDWKDSDGRPISEAYAQRRAVNEPLTEVIQAKGQSETLPELSPNDEFANFEVMDKLLAGGKSAVNGSYVRQALGRGLILKSRLGTNPYKLGFVGASDFHNGLSDSEESSYGGVGEAAVPPGASLPDAGAAAKILAAAPQAMGTPSLFNRGSGGLTGVWAEANTRDSIYAALRRRETFATSGTQMRLRFFGSWNWPAHALKSPDWVATAYRTGVPMGGDLPTSSRVTGAPRFIVQAAKDAVGANLDRIQIVKVWLDRGDYREKVFDVVWSPERKRDRKTGKVPAVRDTVDLKDGTYSNSVGAPMLSGVWKDPEFDARTPAVYYARAMEIPTPRWSTLLAVKRGLPLPGNVALTIQERAFSSPIWYTPPTTGPSARQKSR